MLEGEEDYQMLVEEEEDYQMLVIPKDFRLIALMSSVCKPSKLMINIRLMWFVEHYHHLSPSQIGFHKCRGTSDILVNFEIYIFLKRHFFTHVSSHSHSISFFTDGSKSARGVGYSVVFPDCTYMCRLPLETSIFTAELYAILYALRQLLSRCSSPYVVVSTADVVLIHLRSVASREKVLVDLGPRDPSQPWVMFEPETHLQSNVLFHTNYELLDGFFNRTMHHRRDSDILVLHGFIVGRGRDASFLPPSWRQDPVLFPNKTRRKLAVAFVSNCKDNSGRLQYIRTLKKYARVDVYGRCGDHKCGSSRYAEHAYKPATDPCMRMAGDSYLFYLAFENALCTDYVTEKLYKLLYYPLIPVVLGAANYSALMPPGSYINALHYTPQQLAYKMKYLADHPQKSFSSND
ncbi:4-galactosyl-N-acetylglucosaminide 3-alpha-L-fucosyltransferase FUT6-like [Procambarus clarkii]|uniref:4-galactosyl-N-acetylglucosaminide 3-alpha-L-fucosyltransferase FUT6-like n=1 Tax=Procambarus clarkii TaxID=6728 RepID=UPI003741F745